MRGAFKFTSGRNEVRTKDGCFLRSPRPCLWKEWKGKEEERKGRNSRKRKRKGRNLIPSGAFAYSTGLHSSPLDTVGVSVNVGFPKLGPKMGPKNDPNFEQFGGIHQENCPTHQDAGRSVLKSEKRPSPTHQVGLGTVFQKHCNSVPRPSWWDQLASKSDHKKRNTSPGVPWKRLQEKRVFIK